MKFTGMVVGLALAIIGLVVAVQLLANLYPTLVTALTTLNNTGVTINGSGYRSGTDIVLRAIIAPDGVLPLVLMAVFVIAVIVGLFAMLKNKGR